MRHAVCTLLLWLLTMVSLMASPPVEVRDSILLLSPIGPITTGETGECTEPDTAAVGRVWAHVGTACFANMGSTLCGSGYTANIPITGARLFKAIYYDDYEFLMAMPQEGIELCPDTLGHRGLQTGSVCATGNDGTYRVTKLDYDSEGRVMLTQTFYGSSNAAEVTAYTHDGRVAHRSILTAGPDGCTHTEDYRYSYDAQARLLRVTHSLDGGAERTLADNVYDALGRVSENRRGGSGMFTAHYSYDVRSRIREIACQLFSQRLYYAEPSEGGAPQYGGNISAMDWQTLGDSLRGYRYAYDGMGRLVGADYREKGRPSDHYSTEYAYDLQGNILALRRNGRLYGGVYGVTDDLTYEYDGNRLTKVTNQAPERPAYKDAMYYVDWTDLDTERAYDANGNMVSDADRQITRISYDRQNLPRRIDYLDGSHVDYTYDADGVKLRVDYELNTCSTVLLPPDEDVACDSSACVHIWREYVGNCVYENDTLHMVLIDGGYITFDGASHQPLYHYYAKDYLGNNRVVTDEAGRIEEINHYYPFGGLMGDSRSTATQPYKYIGKELDRTHGLDWYDHGARHYDPVTGRWNVVDALAEKYYLLSPYVSCVNNPVDYLDYNGNVVITLNPQAQENIILTLNSKERRFVQFNKNGKLNIELLNKYQGQSNNFMALRCLANSSTNYIFSVSDQDINGFVFYEKGTNVKYPNNFSYGVTNIPNAENDASPNDNVYIYTATFLDKKTQVRNTAHEGYGHAYFYELSKKDALINPFHTYDIVGHIKEYDDFFKKVILVPIHGKSNSKLEVQISKVENEALENYEESNH